MRKIICQRGMKMFSRIRSYGISGIDGIAIAVEADVSPGLPMFHLVGHLSREVSEAEERVRTAIRNSGITLPPRRITVNLSPAGIRKEGTAFDLAIAVAVLCCLGVIDPDGMEEFTFLGELGLDGTVRPIRGILPMVIASVKDGVRRIFLPKDNVREGRAVMGAELIGVTDLKELCRMLSRRAAIQGEYFDSHMFEEEDHPFAEDYADMIGLKSVKFACMAAAAGRHSILFIGPAGTGKSMAASRLPGILPPLTMEETIELAKIRSICGLLDPSVPFSRKRPFRAPHHSVTQSALVGGGANPRPGEITLATHGVLFLDELAEFSPRTIDLLRQPMEEHKVVISRMKGTMVYPADCMIAAALNGCKCGLYPDRRCQCSDNDRNRYLGKISGPFLDRIDIGVEVPRQKVRSTEQLAGKESWSTASMREKVMQALEIQKKRFSSEPIRYNSEMNSAQIRAYCQLTPEAVQLLDRYSAGDNTSLRGYGKICRVARTLADLDGKEKIDELVLSEALSYRSFQKKYWGRG